MDYWNPNTLIGRHLEHLLFDNFTREFYELCIIKAKLYKSQYYRIFTLCDNSLISGTSNIDITAYNTQMHYLQKFSSILYKSFSSFQTQLKNSFLKTNTISNLRYFTKSFLLLNTKTWNKHSLFTEKWAMHFEKLIECYNRH